MNQQSFQLERSDPLLSNEELISNAIKGLPAKIQQFFNFLMMCVDCYVMTLSLNIEVRRGCLKLQHPFYSNSRMSLVQSTENGRSMRVFSVHIWAAQPGPNGQLSCLHSFKIVLPMKPSYTPNNIICGTLYCIIKKYMIILTVFG